MPAGNHKTALETSKKPSLCLLDPFGKAFPEPLVSEYTLGTVLYFAIGAEHLGNFHSHSISHSISIP